MSAFDGLFSNAAFVDSFGSAIIYRRDETELTISNAMDSKISVDLLLQFGAELSGDYREFVFPISGFTFVIPEVGDRIETASGETWDVCAVGGAPAYEIDADRNYFRVRSALIE